MILLSSYWFIELVGRFHPLLVHFPIGLLIGALILEVITRFQTQEKNYSGVIYLGTASALVAAIMGQLLSLSGDYAGDLLDQHKCLGWATVFLSMITSFIYWRREKLKSWAPLFSLAIVCFSISFAAHYGATITHGEGYLSAPLKQSERTSGVSKALSKWSKSDSLSSSQLDEINLKVRAIFAHQCYQCHSTAKRKGGLALDHEEGVFAGGDSGAILVNGAAEESEIIRRLKLPSDHDEVMPKKGKTLSAEEIDLIALWIDKGAVWTDVGLKVFPEAEMALSKPNLPPIKNGMKHPIDRFVNTYFESKGITWQPLIDDRRFIRRVHLDITGLLPTPNHITTFLKDKNKDKRELLIKELLDDKENYTLHWMSFWNDLLRNDYSGPGFITNGRKQITHWLNKSLKEEKPYNQMVAELVNPTEESEGFIKGIEWRGVVNASQRTELQAAQNISQSLLGLNLKCASCHNSFINNLTLEEAYGFANIFADESLELYRCDKPTGRFTNTTFIYPELGEVMADSLVDRLRLLADVITQPKNGRLYRTLVNRFWDRLFGRGIIAPVDEMDKKPWNQDLLDWLAADFIDNGYSLPKLLETIMTSKAYQLSAVKYDSPFYISSEDFVFRGPTTRRLSAEQFADAISQAIHPLYHGVAYLPDATSLASQWIWYQDYEVERKSLPKPGDRFFRKTFELASLKPIESAEVLITADNEFEFHFNEQKIGSGKDWKQIQKYDLTTSDYKEKNIIAIKGTNEGAIANPGGLLFAMRIKYKDGSQQFVYSDKTWLASNKLPTNTWKEFAFDENEWEQVSTTNATNSHWGKLPGFSFDKKVTDNAFVRASLVKLDPFMKTLGRPTRENVATSRDANATLLQAMMVTNSEFLFNNIQDGAIHLIEQNLGDIALVTHKIYLNTLGRSPTDDERNLIYKQLKSSTKNEVVEDLIWSVLSLPEFQFL